MVLFMVEIAAEEFPFVEQLPKRAKSKLQTLWDTFSEMRAIVATKGMLVPRTFAADLGGVSAQRIDQLCETGHLERIDFGGRPFVTEQSLEAWVKSERVAGRHVAAYSMTKGDLWKSAASSARKMRKNS